MSIVEVVEDAVLVEVPRLPRLQGLVGRFKPHEEEERDCHDDEAASQVEGNPCRDQATHFLRI